MPRRTTQIVTPLELPAICKTLWEREKQRRPGITQAKLAEEMAGDDPKKASYRASAGRTYVSRAINGLPSLQEDGHDGFESFRLEMIAHLTGKSVRGPLFEVPVIE